MDTTSAADENLAWVGLGANMGDRHATLRGAVRALQAQIGTELRISPLVESAAWGVEDQAPFLNQVVGFIPRLGPKPTLKLLNEIEARSGRERKLRWGPRPLDLDILYWPGFVSDDPRLTVPHPRLAARRFVLAPWAKIAPTLVIPGHGETVAQLLAVCSDPLAVVFLP